MATLTTNTVYKTYAALQSERGDAVNLDGSVIVSAGQVNVYFSNAETAPGGVGPMVLDPASPVEGVVTFKQAAKWVLFETVGGTPTIEEYRLVGAAAV